MTMVLPRQSIGIIQNHGSELPSDVELTLIRDAGMPSDGISAQACQRFVTELTGPAIAVGRHPNAGFTTWNSSGVCKIDAEASSLDKCGFWACNNGQDATKCFIQASEGLC